MDTHQTMSTTRVCGFSTFICFVYINYYEGIRGHVFFRIGGAVVNIQRYADDTIILAESEEQLHRLINLVVAKVRKKDYI